MENLLVTVLGHRDSGKSETWNSLFGRRMRTGSRLRRLYLRQGEYVEVFLVYGSAEEREKYIGEIMPDVNPRIVLSSMQYRADVRRTIDYFIERQYSIYYHWLNPGYSDPYDVARFDYLGILNYLIGLGSIGAIRNGKIEVDSRVQEIREFIYAWALFRNLILRD